MRVRRIDIDQDYPSLEQWFLAREWPVAPRKDYMPETGLICESDEGEALACGFIYTTNSPIVYLEWTATNPEALPLRRAQGLKHLVEHVQELVQESEHFATIFQVIPDDKLAGFYEHHFGFINAEKASLMYWNKGVK